VGTLVRILHKRFLEDREECSYILALKAIEMCGSDIQSKLQWV
jgi:hypothetical protein